MKKFSRFFKIFLNLPRTFLVRENYFSTKGKFSQSSTIFLDHRKYNSKDKIISRPTKLSSTTFFQYGFPFFKRVRAIMTKNVLRSVERLSRKMSRIWYIPGKAERLALTSSCVTAIQRITLHFFCHFSPNSFNSYSAVTSSYVKDIHGYFRSNLPTSRYPTNHATTAF